MKTMRYIRTILTAAVFTVMSTAVMSSCSYDEDELSPSNDTSSFVLPQGNHDYDATIQKFFDDYGVYLLYNFTDKDAYWTPSGWTNGEVTSDESDGKQGFTVVKADENYVGQQLSLLNEVWFSKVPESARKALLPTVILLCSEVNDITMSWDFSSYPFKQVCSPSPITSHYNYDNIAVSYGSEAVTSLTDEQKQAISRDLMITWVQYMSERKATPTSEFTSSINYSSSDVTKVYYAAEACAVGTLNAGYQTSAAKDWALFLDMMLMYPESYLTEDAGEFSQWQSFTNYVNGGYVYDYDNVFHGILNAKKDTKGILKQRYDLVRNYFINTYNFDPQSVGNTNN
jgi:hypothetical protein